MKLLIIMMVLTLTSSKMSIDDHGNPRDTDDLTKYRILAVHCVSNPTQEKLREYFKTYSGSCDIHGVVDGTSMACVTAEHQDLFNEVMEEREPIINGVQCYKMPCPNCFKSVKGCKQKK